MSDNLTVDEVKGLKVADLRKALADRGLDNKGVKPELVKRLEDALAAVTTKSDDVATTESEVILLNEADSTTSSTASPVALSVATPPVELASNGNVQDLLSIDKRRERANRFNIPVVRSEDEVLAERAKRFGIVSEDEKMQQRKLKFGIVTEEDKKAQRAKRFGSADEKLAKPSRTASRLDSALSDRRPKRGRNGAAKKKAQSPKKPRAQQ